MLNIKIYKGVPFQSNYNNVCLFSNISAVETFLETYKIGTITGVAMFYANENKITLTQYYEDANYMLIEDTNAVRTKKFYFIDNMIFKSASAVEYSIICDYWNTYNFDITLKNSLCIGGHIDVLGLQDTKCLFRFKSYTNATLITQSNLLINPQSATSTDLMSIVALVNYKATSGNAPTLSGTISKRVAMADGSLQTFLWELAKGTIYVNTLLGRQQYNYDIIKLYVIPSFYYDTLFTNYTGAIKQGDFYTSTGGYYADFVDGYYNEHLVEGALLRDYLPFIFENTFASKNVYTNTTGTINTRIVSKVIVGTLGNYKNIEIPLEDNPLMSIKFTIVGLSQVEISFEITDNKINLTSSFEIPYFNDQYLQYMNRNQNSIDVANITNAINATLSILSLGRNTTGVVSSTLTQNAKLQDLKNNVARIDAVNGNCILTLRYGVGAFISVYNDGAIIEKYNYFGSDTETYIKTFKPSDASLYNYYYLQIPQANLIGNFNENVKKILISIFANGVRIWCDTSKYLNDVYYKK